MKHIIIDDKIVKMSQEFKTALDAHGGTYHAPKSNLLVLKNKLIDGNQKIYVQKIIDKWDSLIVANHQEISSLINEFHAIISTNSIQDVKIQNNKLLYKEIVDAMRYDYVQSTIYPNYILKLGIKTCVYCNAQYAFSVPGKNKYQNYELDHYYPKSKYPYLCTTFINLQPCCLKCNKIKSDRLPDPDKEEIFKLFVPKGTPDVPELFRINNASIARYLASAKSDDLEICFDYPENQKLKNGFEKFFHITRLYNAHKDVAEELIWKQKIYNNVIRDIYKQQFEALGFTDAQFTRFILGNYAQLEEVHKRPLSKMTQDIAKQLKII